MASTAPSLGQGGQTLELAVASTLEGLLCLMCCTASYSLELSLSPLFRSGLEKELAALIASKQITARIDSHAKARAGLCKSLC